MTRHIFLFDGTQNGRDDEHPTNIRILSELAAVLGQRVHYFEGPGNDESDLLHFLGSAFGLGMHETRRDAVAKLVEEHRPGDQIAVFGFSRGAAIARMFCAAVARLGHTTEFLGCFDTVFARLPFGRSQQKPLFGDLHVSGLVQNARHALALDEDRQAFAPNQMNARPGVTECWFPGNHADIGGGYEKRGLADNALAWMVSEARTVTELDFRPLPTRQPDNTPHREPLPPLREKRIARVMVDGNVSGLPPNLYVS